MILLGFTNSFTVSNFLSFGKMFRNVTLQSTIATSIVTGQFQGELVFQVFPDHPEEQMTSMYCFVWCYQCSADADAGTSPSEDDSSQAKKSLFETALPTVDTTSGSDSEQAKVDTAGSGTPRDDTGKPAMT